MDVCESVCERKLPFIGDINFMQTLLLCMCACVCICVVEYVSVCMCARACKRERVCERACACVCGEGGCFYVCVCMFVCL